LGPSRGLALLIRPSRSVLPQLQDLVRLHFPEEIENVVVVCRGVVPGAQSEHVEVKASKMVDPATDPFAVAAAGAPVAAVGMVSRDGAAFESERRRGHVVHAPPQPVAATAAAQAVAASAAVGAVAADGPVVADVVPEDGCGATDPVKAAAQLECGISYLRARSPLSRRRACATVAIQDLLSCGCRFATPGML